MAFSNPEKSIAQCNIQPGMHVADFGVGAGYLATAVAERVGDSGMVYCVDIQQELLTKVTHLAKEHHLETMVFIHGDLERPRGSTLENESVDMVIMSNLLFQIEKKQLVFLEAYRIVRRGGFILVIDWKDSFGGMGPQPEYVFLEKTAQELAKQAGFDTFVSIEAGEHHYGFIAKKV